MMSKPQTCPDELVGTLLGCSGAIALDVVTGEGSRRTVSRPCAIGIALASWPTSPQLRAGPGRLFLKGQNRQSPPFLVAPFRSAHGPGLSSAAARTKSTSSEGIGNWHLLARVGFISNLSPVVLCIANPPADDRTGIAWSWRFARTRVNRRPLGSNLFTKKRKKLAWVVPLEGLSVVALL